MNRNLLFSKILEHYNGFYRQLERAGVGPYRMTRCGAWATSEAAEVFCLFEKIDLSRFRLFIDLGSGDGVVACIASLFTRSIGIEIDPDLCRIARNAAFRLGLQENPAFICGDYLSQSVQRADCLYLYPDKPFKALEDRLSGWTGTLLVYGPHIPPERMQAVRNLRCGKTPLVLYRFA